MTRRTKIVATVGPASDSIETLVKMMRAGVDVVRLNLSHGSLDEQLTRLETVRSAADQVAKPVAVLADLPGPKIRSGPFPDPGITFNAGDMVRLVCGSGPCRHDQLTVPYDRLLEDLHPGNRVELGDGAITLGVVDVEEEAVCAEVITGGHSSGRPGVHLPSQHTRLETPTDEDLELVRVMVDAGIDFAAVSFVHEAEDVEKVREVVGTGARLVAKIETSAAIDDLQRITAASDAVMVARGDLGLDCPIEDVPHLQKLIVRHCVEVGVPVITATQMLESMIHSPSPTRAEVSDIANAVFDGTDAVMLSGETAVGQHPVRVVETMSMIAERAERDARYRQWARLLGQVQRSPEWANVPATDRITAAVTHAALEAAVDVGATAILCCTRSGRTANAMARFRPEAELIGLAPDPATVHSMALTWGVLPVRVETYNSTDEMVWFAIERAVELGHVADGDTVLVLAGAPNLHAVESFPGRPTAAGRPVGPATDVLRIVRIG